MDKVVVKCGKLLDDVDGFCSRRYMPRRLAITETDILFSFTKTLFGQKNKSRYTTTSS